MKKPAGDTSGVEERALASATSVQPAGATRLPRIRSMFRPTRVPRPWRTLNSSEIRVDTMSRWRRGWSNGQAVHDAPGRREVDLGRVAVSRLWRVHALLVVERQRNRHAIFQRCHHAQSPVELCRRQ
jgi:hypothetical protein